jgi:FKBP-type peptidyl-prolyl cis-trans isomerase SlyD
MDISKDCVVTFHYQLFNDQDKAIESSFDAEPVAFLVGHNNIIAGLESAMQGKAAGDQVSVTLPPEQAYGLRNDSMSQKVPVKHLQTQGKPKAGMVATVQTEQGSRQVTITKMGKFMATVDFNHPLAGKTLRFDIAIVDVREASAEELAHGHAHGLGGHQH